MLLWYQKNGFNNVIRIRNGVCLKRFVNLKKEKTDKKILGYVGTLSKWIDYELFEEVIKANSECLIIIIGESYKSDYANVFKKYENVKLLGKQKPEEVVRILSKVDIALNLYRTEEWLDVDSMKIFEYLALGIPVVCSGFHPFLHEDFNNLLYIGNNYDEIQEHINYLLGKGYEDKNANNFLRSHTWSNRIEEFITYLKSK
jgi:glycosyltransferase involved in cell wall biosynthesis